MLSQTAEYALRAAVYLASRGAEPVTNRLLAEAIHVPTSYLAKVMKSLAQAGLVKSRRGKKGGFSMPNADDVTALDVIDAVDPIHRITQCPLEAPFDCAELCPLHRRIDDAIEKVRDSFEAASIRELAELSYGNKKQD